MPVFRRRPRSGSQDSTTYQSHDWQMTVYFASHGKYDDSFSIDSKSRDELEEFAREIRLRMKGGLDDLTFDIKLADGAEQFIDCSRVQRVKIVPRTNTRRISDDAIVWYFPF